MKSYALFLIGLTLAYVPPSFGCTAFCLAGRDRVVVGKSYDWFFGHGHGAVYTNPRGIARTALILDESPNPARWTSKWGSVTLTQFGRGVPISGMNEKGLVVELLQLPAAEYDSKDVDRPYVNESQWAQYQLDRFGDVEDVLAHLGDVRIQRAYTGIHYFVADRSGRSATIEFLRGRAVVHTGVDLPVPVLTNDTYAESLESARWPQNGRFSALGGRRSEVRFRDAQRLTDTVKTTADADLSDLAWTILKAVRLNGLASDALLEPSQWNIVYDLKAGTIDFRTRGSKTLKRIDVNKVDLNEGAPELTADMNLPVKGDFIPSLRPYDAAANEALVRKNTLLFTLSGQRAKIAPAVDYGRVRSVGQ